MTTKEYKRVNTILSKVQAEIEKEAMDAGIDITSDEFQVMLKKAEQKVFEKLGFIASDYYALSDSIVPVTKGELATLVETINSELSKIVIPSKEEITAIARSAAEKFVKPPQITNQIIKEIVIEKPQIIKETKTEKIIQNEKYDDTELRNAIDAFNTRIEAIKIPTLLKQHDLKKFKEELITEWQSNLKEAINIRNMPDFRKLAMGLRQDIDTLSSSVSSISSFKVPSSGTVNGSNATFVWATAPNVIVVDQGRAMQKTSSDGTVNWTGTTTTILTIAPNFDIYALA